MLKNISVIESLSRLSSHAWVLIVLSVTLFAYNAYQHGGYAVDDAYISFRFLDNWLNSQGMVFNPGERVEGYTNFLWLLVLAPIRVLGVPVEIAALLVNLISVIIVAYAVYHSVRLLATATPTLALGGWVLLAGYGSFAFWLTAGMEPLLLAALLSWANMLVLREARISVPAALIYAAAVLTRPDAAIFALVAFLFYLPVRSLTISSLTKKRLQDYTISVAVFILPLLLHLLWRWSYYGELLPNTYYAKMHPDSELMMRFGLAYVERFLWAGGALLIVIVVVGLLNKALWSRHALMLTAQVLIFCLYIIKVGGDYMLYFRFFIPLIPMLCILSVVVIERCYARRNHTALYHSATIVTLAVLMTFSLAQSSEMEQAPGVRRSHADNEVFADWISTVLPKDTVVAMNLVGLVPYRTGFRTIDMLGLTDKHIARGKVALPRVGTGSYIGHFKYDGQYVCDLMPDVMLPTTIMLHTAPNAEQARISVMNRSYDSDRDFWQTNACAKAYEAHYKELLPNKFVVMYINRSFLSRLEQR